jgi:hypothetical protein
VVETIGKKFTTIMIGHAESVITQISHSVKSATDVKHPALVAVVGDPVEETVVETDAVAAVDTVVETEAETAVETDAVAAVDTVEEIVVITIGAHKAATQIIVMQRENAQGTLTIGDQTTSNRRRTTDTTIDWRLTT